MNSATDKTNIIPVFVVKSVVVVNAYIVQVITITIYKL